MRKVLSALCLSLITATFISINQTANAQSSNAPSDPYTDYLRHLNQHFTARRTFESSRARYTSFKTLQAKETLTKDSIEMLQTGRAALTQYTYYLAQNLERTTAINDRVKSEILTDLQTHNGYLASVENVLSDTATFNEINTHSKALVARYGYVKTTGNQALLYIDAVRLYDHITKQKTLIDEIENITRTLPDDLREKTLSQNWINEARIDNSKDEEATLSLIDQIYPQPVIRGNNPPKRAFEELNSTASQTALSQISARVVNRATKAQETFNIISEGYRKL